jgi:copper(I)-binding protein
MKSIITVIVLAIGLSTYAHENVKPSIKVSDAYIRLLPPSSPNTGGFVNLTNTSKKDIKLIKASSGLSKKLELHTLIKDGDIMKMREVDSILIKANSSTMLKPGGLHLMFMGLKDTLVLNKEISVTLYFSDSSHLDVKFKTLDK